MAAKYVGLDTSVVVRLLVGLPEAQAREAFKFIQEIQAEKKQAVVSDLVVAEAYFAMITAYKVSIPDALNRLSAFLESGLAYPEPSGSALETLKEQVKTRAGFMDRFIRNQYLAYAEEVVTFDTDFAKMDRVKRLKG